MNFDEVVGEIERAEALVLQFEKSTQDGRSRALRESGMGWNAIWKAY